MGRLRRHLCILHAAITLTLIPGVLLFDFIGHYSTAEGSEAVRKIEERVAVAIVWPARMIADWRNDAVWTHHGGRWPGTWPVAIGMQMQMMKYALPFWYLVLAGSVEILRFAVLRKRARQAP